MKIPVELKVKAHEILAAQPAIAKYVCGGQNTSKLSAEGVLVCAIYRFFELHCGDLPLVTELQLQAEEATLRATLTNRTDAGASPTALVSSLEDSLAIVGGHGLVEMVADRTTFALKMLSIIACLTQPFRTVDRPPTPAPMKIDDPAVWNLVVEGRPELTALKQHLVKREMDPEFRTVS